MLLEHKNVVIYGGAGAVGSAVASTFAREGARVFLTGRDRAALEPVAKEIAAAGGAVETAEVDVLDENAVESHLDAVTAKFTTVDVSFNAIGIPQRGVRGALTGELSVESFLLPVATYAQAHFVTARAAARRMATQRSGVIVMNTSQPVVWQYRGSAEWATPGRRLMHSTGSCLWNTASKACGRYVCAPPTRRKRR